MHVRTFDTSSGNMKDVSAFGKVLDRVNIMAYDINGAFNSTSGTCKSATFTIQMLTQGLL